MQPKTTVYLGPSMSWPGFFISKGHIFNGPASTEVEELKARNKSFATLFVTPENVAKQRRNLQNGVSHITQCYHDVYTEYATNKEIK